MHNKFTLDQVKEKLKTVTDPEIGLDVVSLGFIYDIEFEDDIVKVEYSLTNPACPMGNLIHQQIKQALLDLVDHDEERVELKQVFDPPWTPEMMSEEARLKLDL